MSASKELFLQFGGELKFIPGIHYFMSIEQWESLPILGLQIPPVVGDGFATVTDPIVGIRITAVHEITQTVRIECYATFGHPAAPKLIQDEV